MEARGNGVESKLRVKLVRRPVWLFTCSTCPGSTLVNNSWWKFLFSLSARTWHKKRLEPVGVRPVSVHSLNPLLGCLFPLYSSSPPCSVSAFYWRPLGQGPCATDMEHWVFRPDLPLSIRASQVTQRERLWSITGISYAVKRVCNLNLSVFKSIGSDY